MILASTPALAQDGQRRTGDPVDRPRTDKNIPRADTSNPPPETTNQILPPVPASLEDPAPPGTNAVPALPNAGRPGVPARPGQAAGRAVPGQQGRPIPGIRSVEGVVVQINRTSKDDASQPGLQNELIRLTVDPSQTWTEYATVGPETPAEDKATPPDAKKSDDKAPIAKAVKSVVKGVLADDKNPGLTASERKPSNGPSQTGNVEVAVTNRTRVFVHARSPEGINLYGAATISSPDTTPSGVGVTGHVPNRPRPAELATNFTNIKVGSFVSIRYRNVQGTNEAFNVNLIELPLVDPGEELGTAGLPGRPAAAPVANPAARRAPGAIPPPSNGLPVREPVVPTRPVAPDVPR